MCHNFEMETSMDMCIRAVVAGLVLLITPTSWGQNLLATTTLGVSGIAKEDALLLVECWDATDEQAKAIHDVTDGAMVRLRVIRTEMRRAQRWLSINEDRVKYDDITKKATKEMEDAERAWLENLKTLASPGSEDGWRRFELSRRRVCVISGIDPRVQDIAAMLAVVGADEDANPELKAIVLRWEQEVNALIERWGRDIQHVDWNALAPSEREQKLNERNEIRISILSTTIKNRRAAAALLDAEKQRLLLYLAARRVWSGFAPVLENEPVMQEVLQLELEHERRDEFLTVARQAQAKVDKELEIIVGELENALMDSKSGGPDLKTFDALKKRMTALQRAFEADVLQMLTKKERREYELLAVAERQRAEESNWRMGNVRDLPGIVENR